MNNLGLLLLRLTAGGFMLTHGWPKLANFSSRASQFPDPLGVGSELSLALAVFAEFFCALLLVLGLFTRAALTQLIATMAVAGFIVHAADPFQRKELAFVYLGMFLCLFLTGPGDFSLGRRLGHRKFWLK